MTMRTRVALVTGASSGIGAACAQALVSKGFSVSLTGRSLDRLQQVEYMCRTKRHNMQVSVMATVGDLTEPKVIRKVVHKTLEQHGHIDVLINNAGIISDEAFRWDTPIEVYDEIMKVNLRSAIELTQSCIPHLLESRGNIVNVSSTVALRTASPTAYALSKAALNYYTRGLALVLAPKGVRVNAVCPGAVHTPMFDEFVPHDMKTKKFMELLAQLHPIGRVGTPDEVAEMVAFLADGDKAGFITGSTVKIDGGLDLANCWSIAEDAKKLDAFQQLKTILEAAGGDFSCPEKGSETDRQ